MVVQRELSAIQGTTVLIYDQTCAAEKRRRRKRGTFPDPDKRVYINPAVCEGCGDCGVKSNCVAVLPLETALGRKRQIDQSACNKDFSCVEGFCPSFVTLHGAKPRKADGGHGRPNRVVDALPEPELPLLDEPFTMIASGVGGTGVVTISAVLAQAAHNAGLGFGAIDMTGLAQKGGAVACHMRVAKNADQIHAIRVGVGGADLILGGDLVVVASSKLLDTVKPGKTAVVYSTYEMTTGDFTRNANLTVPGAKLRQAISERVRGGPLAAFDAHSAAVGLFGDAIGANMLLLGYAYQLGKLPIPSGAIEEAIRLNGAAVSMNIEAFRLGRLAAHDRSAFDRLLGDGLQAAAEQVDATDQTLEQIIEVRAKHLAAYQDEALARRYRERVALVAAAEHDKAKGMTGLAAAAGRGYFKLLAYKDEYEVARLFTDGTLDADIQSRFEGVGRVEYHLAPPLLSWIWRDKSTGHPRKARLPGWLVKPLFRLLARGKALRGTRYDIFGYSAERRLERRMIEDYERIMDELVQRLSPATHETAKALAALPLEVRGFGHVKHAAYEATRGRERALLEALRAPDPVKAAAE